MCWCSGRGDGVDQGDCEMNGEDDCIVHIFDNLMINGCKNKS
jgi:hypothetical protein